MNGLIAIFEEIWQTLLKIMAADLHWKESHSALLAQMFMSWGTSARGDE
jgi:hypothetical protein